MGTEISLTIEGISLSYAKNNMGIDFGFLFQKGDESRRKLDGINYDYYEENPDKKGDLDDYEEVFARPLARILPRLQLFGATLESARAEYEAVLADAIEIQARWDEDPSYSFPKIDFLSFEEFCDLANRYPLSTLGHGYTSDDENAKGRLKSDRDFDRIPSTDNSDMFWSEASYLGAKLCVLSAESMLQVFGLSPANANADVVWEFGPLVHAGWESREAFRPGAARTQNVLIATEGASDARILRRAFDLLRPEVADCFNFIDVDERHHFWGTGNLVKFAEGLLRIDVQNKVLFLLDNDAEGVDAFRKLNALNLPPNMRSMVLPSLSEFSEFPARGPEGIGISDINGRAAAIECYLDLKIPGFPPAQVLWSNYKKEIDAWHGALEFKESYQRHFYDRSPDEIRSGSYDSSKLQKLLDAVIEEAALV